MGKNIDGAYQPKKLLKHYDRVCSFLGGEDVIPVTVEMNITNRCNYHCPWCSEGTYRGKHANAELDATVVIRAAESMLSCGVRSITWEGGGEPTLHREFNRILANLPNGIDHGLITNGSLLHKIPPELLNKFKYIRISFDASDREVYRKIHGVDQIDRVLENTSYVAKYFNGILGFSYIVSDDTVQGMETAAVLAKNAGAHYIQFKPMLQHNGTIAYVDMGTKLTDVMTYSTSPSFNVFLSRFSDEEVGTPFGVRDYTFCRAHRFVGAVTATGSVELCCNLKHRFPDLFSFGNLNSLDFAAIWYGQDRKNILAKVEKDPNFIKKYCGYCRMNEFNMILEDHVNNGRYSPLWRFI